MAQIQSVRSIIAVTVSAAAVAILAGCSMPKASDFKPSKLLSLGDDDEPEEGIPVRMVGTWVDTVHTKAGQPAERGFGGRLVFYAAKEEKPILVDGQLVVYAFDETGRAVTDNKPTRRYVFPPDQMPLHMSESELGASYSFFLPWDEVGGPQTEVSLICRFEPKGGAVITSEQTRHRLPGTIPTTKLADGKPPRLPEGVPYRPAQPTLESIQASRVHDPNLQQASYVSAIPDNVPVAAVNGAAPINSGEMISTTIPLPPHYELPIGQPIPAPAASGLAQPVRHATPPVQTPPAAAPAMSAPVSVPAKPVTQPTRLGFGALPARQSITPMVLMPTTYSPPVQSYGIVPPYQAQPAAMQTAAQQAAVAIPTRTVAWNTVQPAQQQALQQPQPFAPQQQTGMQPISAIPQPLPAAMNTVANYPAGAATLQ
jgi:hypothetical protein